FSASNYLQVGQKYGLSSNKPIYHGHVSLGSFTNQSDHELLQAYCNRPEFRSNPSRCQVLAPHSSYHEWVYRNAKSFHDYVQNYLFHFGVERDGEHRYLITTLANHYSKDANIEGMWNLFNQVGSKVCLNIAFI